jgi:hypothetical protein
MKEPDDYTQKRNMTGLAIAMDDDSELCAMPDAAPAS